ncbi:putative heavy metal-associated domain superfamily [Helianthus annuus]|nr:putative heavy metal-associated domain superfamily [Helianthus annuus]
MQAENDAKENAVFAAAKHCRFESVLQKTVDATVSALNHSKTTHDSVIEMGKQHLTAVDTLIRLVTVKYNNECCRSALDSNDRHDHEFNSLRVTTKDDVLKTSEDISKHTDSKISNRSRGVTWVYSPVVYCKPRVDEDVVWLSYWPIGNLLDAGDDVYVDIIEKEGTIIISGYGASLVYKDGGEVEEKSEEEVIGGDLSRFEVTKGGYYLCRHNFFNSIIPATLFGERIQISDSRRWRTGRWISSFEEANNFRNPNHYKCKVTLGVNFNSESEIKKIEKAVSSVPGVESVYNDKEIGRMIVIGRFDHQAVVTCVRGFEKMVQVLQRKLLEF